MKELEFNWTSLNIVEWTGKEHKNVLRDIEDEILKLKKGDLLNYVNNNFKESYYKTNNVKNYKMYKLTIIGLLQISTRYDCITRAKVINKAIYNDNKLKSSLIETRFYKLNKGGNYGKYVK